MKTCGQYTHTHTHRERDKHMRARREKEKERGREKEMKRERGQLTFLANFQQGHTGLQTKNKSQALSHTIHRVAANKDQR